MATHTAAWSNGRYWNNCMALDGGFNDVNKAGPYLTRQIDIEMWYLETVSASHA